MALMGFASDFIENTGRFLALLQKKRQTPVVD
jgi:hypothetical protein